MTNVIHEMIANMHEFPDVFIHPDLGRISFRHTRECRDVAYLVVSALVFLCDGVRSRPSVVMGDIF